MSFGCEKLAKPVGDELRIVGQTELRLLSICESHDSKYNLNVYVWNVRYMVYIVFSTFLKLQSIEKLNKPKFHSNSRIRNDIIGLSA